ncbi:MAG: biotin/lipoyl-binding protein, partial [Cyanobacteria bacterium J06636_27]
MQIISKPSSKLISVIATATLLTSGIAIFGISQTGLLTSSETPVVEVPPTIKKVAALGRLEPQGEIIHLSAPLNLDGDRVTKLLVEEGNRVKAGEVIAILDSQKTLQDELLKAKEQVRMAEAKLAQIKAGAKTGEIKAQEATIARLQSEKTNQIAAQQATIYRIQAEKNTEIAAQKATITRLQAEVDNENFEYQRYQG